MKNLTLIKVLIISFIILSGANMFFSWLADQAGQAVIIMYQKRYDTSSAANLLRISSAEMTRIIRAYASLQEGDQPILYQRQIDYNRANNLYLMMRNDPNATEEELHFLRISIDAQDSLREMDALAFDLIAEGNYQLAADLVYGREYRDFGIAFTASISQLIGLLDARLQEEILAAERLDSLYQTNAQIAVFLFAVVSVLGMLYLHRAVKVHMKREKDAKEMNEFILTSAPFTISIWGSDHKPAYVNEQVVKLLGLKNSEQYLTEYLDFNPKLQSCGTPSTEKMVEIFETVLEEGSIRVGWLHTSSSGELIPTEVHMLRFIHNEKPAMLTYITDLRQAHATMQQEQALAEAKSESQAKTRFLARMSHEIRTPLSSIMGITEIQLQTGKHTAEATEAFLRIHNSSDVLLTIINDILDLAKVEAGKMEIVEESYEVASMIVDTVQLNLIYIGSKGIEFKMNVDENLPTHLIGDALRIKQVLNNLLSNAFKYTNTGGVTISISVEPGADSNEIIVVFRVEDTGMGMTPEQLETLFAEYSRGDTKQIRFIEGTGLGMSIANHLISMMNGKLEVESTVDVGTTITVKIPQKCDSSHVLGREAVESLEKLKDSHRTVLRKGYKLDYEPMPYGKVLVVDDVESNLYVARGLMMPYKLQIETVGSGQEAIDKIEAGNVYDIIFMDHMMPRMDGMQAGKIIQDMGYTSPIVALTANTIKGQADLFLGNGFAGFISKPIDVNVLNSTLLRFVRDKQPQDVIDAARAATDNIDQPVPDNFSAELERVFLRDAEKVLEILEPIAREASFEGESLKSFATQIHAIKSALANVGQNTLSESAYALEKAARSNRTDVLKEETPFFIQSLKNIADAIRPATQQEAGDDDKSFLKEHLQTLHEACESYDIVGIKNALNALTSKTFSKQATDVINQISSHVLYGDYEDAATLAKEGMPWLFSS